ncbi:hypothetical protein GCM10020295_06890 [Streptomyces cinereospinus]
MRPGRHPCPAKLEPWRAVRRHAAAGAIVLALLGAGLPARAADDKQPDLTRFYRQKVAWTACEGAQAPEDLQCGKVTVPLDYARPGAGTLDLALARFRASGEKRGSLLLNFGGPGGPGVSELAASGDDFMDPVRRLRRGELRSARRRPVLPGQLRQRPVRRRGVTVGTDEALRDPQAVLRQLQKAARECAKHLGRYCRTSAR